MTEILNVMHNFNAAWGDAWVAWLEEPTPEMGGRTSAKMPN